MPVCQLQEVKCTDQNRCLSYAKEVGKAKFITILDFARGYWQVSVADEDRHKLHLLALLVYTNSM